MEIEVEDDFPGHIIHQASLWDNCELLLDLLRGDLKEEIECQDSWGRTALHAAATTSDSQCLTVLLQFGANPNAVSGGQDNFKTPLHTSAEHGFLSNVKLLVEAGADILLLEGRALTAAQLAERAGHIETFNYLSAIASERENAKECHYANLRDAVSNGNVHSFMDLIKPLSIEDRKELLNKMPHGTNTLLFKAAEQGNMELVNALLEHGSDGELIHPVTKYSPLYIAAYNGHKSIFSKLLLRFPNLAKVQTVEKWLPIHAACINGHNEILEHLLHFDFPPQYLLTFKSFGREHVEYEMAFDVNLKDVSDQTCLYIACQMGNTRIAEILLKFRVPRKNSLLASTATSPTKAKVSKGIQGIISKLCSSTSTNKCAQDLVAPVEVNLYSEGYQTPLHVAVKNKNYNLASCLLAAGSDVNLPILTPVTSHLVTIVKHESSCQHRVEEKNKESSSLAEACKNRDLGMIELLLKYGARDDDSKALSTVIRDDLILGKLLALKAHIDLEHSLSEKDLQNKIFSGGGKKLLATSLIPKVAVNVNWHDQKLDKICESWLVLAGLKLNPKLRLAPGRGELLSLHSITRIDLSNNSLDSIPSILFNLSSLVYLNISGNKINVLELPSNRCISYLQELHLQENRIEKCPDTLFTQFPSLAILNLSNNKLTSLPSSLWAANGLTDLNVSLNLISDLPLSSLHTLTKFSVDFQKEEKNVFEASRKKSFDSPSHETLWRKRGENFLSEHIVEDSKANKSMVGGVNLQSLNLSHNSFTNIPKLLACLATKLQRLNLAFNRIEHMGKISDIPMSLKQLDLTQNNISSWFSREEQYSDQCYAQAESLTCIHRIRNSRLENLRTLLLSGNNLKNLEISYEMSGEGETRKNLWFPNLTMLDISENKLSVLTSRISALSQLSVLNLSGNKDLCELPPQLGLLSRIWNLNFQGCNLQEPLKSLVERKGSKTMDIVGYLKSVLEDARPYGRMKLMIVGVHGIGKTSLISLLRLEGSGKGADSWSKRVGGSGTTGGNDKFNSKMSTVGIDIGTLVLEKGSKGPITFRTWDFGGQREYYVTHSYFLSKRSLYLVIWNICDGDRGLNEVHGWLVNIQSRAPNSPIILVGTHYDLVSEKFPPGYLDYLQQKIRDRFICISDPEKRGLPRVLMSIEISCKTRYNIKYLSNVIYDTAISLKTSNGKALLEQNVPSKYIYLEEIVSFLSHERKAKGQDPVLSEEEFKSSASSLLSSSFGLKFRDDSEIMQACSFLHDNGILLHYDDSSLKDLYFLDPQWLCDMLSKVVTIREINPFAQGGSMKVQDLAFLFKGHSLATQDYILSLLSKFELAIPYDGLHLLIPSLLPTFEQINIGYNEVRVRIALHSRGWKLSGELDSNFHVRSTEIEENVPLKKSNLPSITRFVMLSYYPSGFWPRLMSRILSDDRTIEIIRKYLCVPSYDSTHEVMAVVSKDAEWLCWQTGIELHYGDLVLLRIKEISGEKPYTFMLRRDDEGDICENFSSDKSSQDESIWDVVDLAEYSLLEINLPSQSLVLDQKNGETLVLYPSIESITKLLTLSVEAVDNLLEDWYPSIGTRFVHTSEGKYLVTRLCPCPLCFPPPKTVLDSSETSSCSNTKNSRTSTDSGMGQSPNSTVLTNDPELNTPGIIRHRTGLAFETPKFGCSQAGLGLNYFLKSESSKGLSSMSRNYYAWTIEHCILEAQGSEEKTVRCPKHGKISVSDVAPDILFYDLPKKYRLNSNDILKKELLGRGAFGFVFSGVLRGTLDVAIKMFSPIDPGTSNEEAQTAYRAAKTKWCRSPSQSACRAYLASRGEIRVLFWVSHPNIIPFLGLSQSPLSIVMPKAPKGALDIVLSDFERCQDHVAPETVKELLIQLSKALDYLHGHKIVYRDLKAENILVWKFPSPFALQKDLIFVDIKLADYGISRSAMPTGNKGFGGTEGFMAPEIIRYNGEEEYTEKVDTFSLGMVLYQILSLKQPFDGCENVKESILEGFRPSLYKPQLYPTYIIDLMVICWEGEHRHRPSAAEIFNIVSSPDFTLLRDVISIGNPPNTWEPNVVTSLGIGDNEVWASCSTGTLYSVKNSREGFISCKSLTFIPGVVTAMAKVLNSVWMGDTLARVHIFELDESNSRRELDLEVDVSQGHSLGACVSIQPLSNKVALAFSGGRLFLFDATSTLLLTELGQSTILHSLAVRNYSDCEKNEIWAGEKGGEIQVFTLCGEKVTFQSTLCHLQNYQGEVSLEALQVLTIAAHPTRDLMFSYVFPGSLIYSWQGEQKEIQDRLDVGKSVPSLETEDSLLSKSIQVTALYSSKDLLFVGTNVGYVFIVGVLNLNIICSFHPFSLDVRSFWVSEKCFLEKEENERQEENESANKSIQLVIFGKNYYHPFDTRASFRNEQRRAHALLYNLN